MLKRSSTGEAGFSTVKAVFGLAASVLFVVMGFTVLDRVGVNLPNPFDDGHDGDEEASGSLRVEGQTPLTATDTLVVKIGEGEATVSIKAHQNWDRPGSVLNGDFQSTNGTASVRDPDDGDQPATITVRVEYCAEAAATRSTQPDADGATGPPATDEITFDMGSLFVCDVEWLPSAANEAAFAQDDTPDDFQGRFEELIKGTAVAAVAASECPDSLVEDYTSDEFRDFLAQSLADREDVPVVNVTVTPGLAGTTSEATQRDLTEELRDFTRNDVLDIDAFSGSGTAVEDSCFVDTTGEPLESLGEIFVPDPRNL